MKFKNMLKVFFLLFIVLLNDTVLSKENLLKEELFRKKSGGGGSSKKKGGHGVSKKRPGNGQLNRKSSAAVAAPPGSPNTTNTSQPTNNQEYERMMNMKDRNLLLLNAEVVNAKPPSDKDSGEIQVFPQQALAGTEFSWTFLWWTAMHFPAQNALKSDNNYWLSARGREHDHWEAVFATPQKIDEIEIHWRLAPKRFRVFFKLDEKEDYLPVTDVVHKTSFVNKEGKIQDKDAYSEYNAVVFHKPIFARRIRINLNEPIKKQSFSILSVKFYQKKTTLLIKNELMDESEHWCYYVNTNLPVQNTKVEAYPCLKALTLQNNNELWIHNTDSTIRHYNSDLCLAFDVENELVLKSCGAYNPAFTVQNRKDNSLYFTGYEKNCLVMDESKKISGNFISDDTDVIVTSQADGQTFKKENIKFSGENIWHSVPGQEKATVQILFGKMHKGPNKGKYETKKIDLIKIDWIKMPKKFMLYTWRPGYSWTLRAVYDNYKEKVSDIQIIGEEASAIMIVLDKSHVYPELGNITGYAIREVTITYNSIKLKNDNCANYKESLKVFDFDTQNYHKLESKKDYEEVRKKLSTNYEKSIASYNQMKNSGMSTLKTHNQAQGLMSKLSKLKKSIAGETIKKLRNFKSDLLPKISNSVFLDQINSKGPAGLVNSIMRQKSTKGGLGTKDSPGIDCLSIKKLRKNTLSGWYYLKNECMSKTIRVFCDFTIIGDAVDIVIFNDDQPEPNPDLSHLGITDFNSIRYQCAKLGLFPIQVSNARSVERIYQVLELVGYDLSKPVVVPLGYDYTCQNGKCGGIINSLNDKQSSVISSFFAEAGKAKSGLVVTPGPFAGLGYSNSHSMIKFDPNSVRITALICSTNHFQTDSTDSQVKTISCDTSPMSNTDLFIERASVLVECPSSCAQSTTPIYGTDVFHLKSSVCKAAIHSQILGAMGGRLYVRVSKTDVKYLGSTQNGIKSEDYNSNDGLSSFSLIKYEPKCPINQFAELAKKEKETKEAEKSTISSRSSFMETSTTVMLSQAQEKFESDLNSNELEGVDMDDIHRAGIHASSDSMRSLSKPDNDQEDFKYNHSEQNNLNENISQTTISGVNEDMVNDVNSMVGYNNDHGMQNNQFDVNNVNFDQGEKNSNSSQPDDPYNFSEVENSESESLEEQNSDKRDRLTTEESQNSMAENMNSNIQNAQNIANSIANKVAGSSPQPRVPPPALPQAPRPGQTKPPEEEAPKQPTNKRTEPTTDDGNKVMMKIRKAVDWVYMSELEKKHEKIKQQIKLFQKGLSWSKKGSDLSLVNIKRKFLNIYQIRCRGNPSQKIIKPPLHLKISITSKQHTYSQSPNFYVLKNKSNSLIII